jgi:hypothetical protein
MATRYVRKTGSDSNGGTSPSDAWLTIGKALGASGISSGDTVYVGAGVYRESVTVAMTSAVAETKIIGDVTGQFTGDAGEVRWTAYVTNDKTLPVSASALVLTGRDFLTFENIVFIGGTGSPIDATSNNATNITWRRCEFHLGGSSGSTLLIDAGFTAGTAPNWTVDSCVFGASTGVKLRFNLVVSGSADFDTGIVIKNSIFHTGGNFAVTFAGSTGTGKPGNAKFINNTVLSPSGVSTGAVFNTASPCLVYGNVFICFTGTALSANTAGQITENYNLIHATTARSSVTAGANSISNGSYSWAMMSFGAEMLRGFQCRPFGMPTEGSPLLGFGAHPEVLTVDALGASRPSGGQITSGVGALERGNSGAKESTVIRTAGGSALKIIGPGYQDFQVPVDATSTTISIYGRYDSTHGATNKPQMQILQGGECGVADQTITMTAAADTWEQLSATFTPTAKGIVTVRLISRAAAAAGIAYFDD